MKLGLFGRVTLAGLAALALGLSMTACGGGTVAFLWTFGSQYNQIVGYKVDDYTGNLTETLGSPTAIPGINPLNMVVKTGGRYVYVLARGTGGVPGDGTCGTNVTGPCAAQNDGIFLYSVGNDGVLTFQQAYGSQGYVHVWAQMDSTGSFLYVLDKYALEANCPTATLSTSCPTGTSYNGAITVFASDPDTGRLTLLTNQAVKDPLISNGQQNLSYFPVGGNPIMSKFINSCLYTIDGADNTVFPYVQGSTGQLSLTTNGPISTGATQLTSINGGSNYVILTDGNNGSSTNYILPYQTQGGCTLSSTVGGKVPNPTSLANPANSVIDNAGNFLYVLYGNTVGGTTQAASGIVGYHLQTGVAPQPLTTQNPSSVGSGPTCIVEDPQTSQYMYISNRNDGTITGERLNPSTGTLSPLQNGSTFPATGQLSCLAISGNVD